jgi:tetratricopeptide (TPR) repeat protein
MIAGQPVEIAVAPVSSNTVRLSVIPIENGKLKPIPDNDALVQQAWAPPRAQLRSLAEPQTVRLENLLVRVARDPLCISVEDKDGRLVQKLRIDEYSAKVFFSLGDGLLLGLGEGGPQFDRRGDVDQMRSGPKAREAVAKARELDPELAEAHASMALVEMMSDWNWLSAEQGFKPAIKLNPTYTPARQWYAKLLTALGRHEEALAQLS